MADDTSDLRTRAEAGDPSAQLMLSQHLLFGKGVKPAPAESMRWLLAACESRHAPALLRHAMLATLGLGRPRNLQEAIELVAMAADCGDESAQGQLACLGGVVGFDASYWASQPKIVQRFDAPRIFTIEQFLPERVCAWLMERTRERQQRARSFDLATGAYTHSTYRTSTEAHVPRFESDMVVQLVQLRIAGVTAIPLMHQEAGVVLRYGPGEEYLPHYDFIKSVAHAQRAIGELETLGQRIGTVLTYLNDGYEGGETEFPLLDWRFKGKAGDALLFWNVSLDGQLEWQSRHAGLPVTSGEKWLLTKWLRARPVPLA